MTHVSKTIHSLLMCVSRESFVRPRPGVPRNYRSQRGDFVFSFRVEVGRWVSFTVIVEFSSTDVL